MAKNEFEIALNDSATIKQNGQTGNEEFININSYKEVDGKEVWYKRTSCVAHTKAFTLQTLEIEQKMLAKAGIIVSFKEGNNKKQQEEFSTIDLSALGI
jgi:hypothetical protein